MFSRICKKLDELEASGKPISQLQLPLPHNPKVSRNTPRRRLPDPNGSSKKGWVSPHRNSAYARCAAYASHIGLVSLVLNELNMCYHPAWASGPMLPGRAGEKMTTVPEIEAAIADLGVRVVAAHWGCQTAIHDQAQLLYYQTELPACIFLTKLRLAVGQISEKLARCVRLMRWNTDTRRRRVASRYTHHKRCLEHPQLRRYAGLARGKTSPLRQVMVVCEEDEEEEEEPEQPLLPVLLPSPTLSAESSLVVHWEYFPNIQPDRTSLPAPNKVTKCF
ncbi:hypothetical protein F4775DRAFT_595391 [Biscogniauxia sp. FL1348]|nr:hypothetical protein F4775DRAFT_595391 [Biscogniauxia sp. FL1348]